jgi:hypothetical protein
LTEAFLVAVLSLACFFVALEDVFDPCGGGLIFVLAARLAMLSFVKKISHPDR